MRLSLFDAVFFAGMVGAAELYFLAQSVRLGATYVEQALVLTLPLCVGAIGPWLALAVTAKRWRRKQVVVTGACGQAAVLATIVLADQQGMLSPVRLIGLVCAYQICGQGAGTAWSSWYGDLVPAALRGRYFAKRNRVTHIGACAALIGAGVTLQLMEPGAAGTVPISAGGRGFAVIFSAAALFRLASAIALALSPADSGLPSPTRRPSSRAATADKNTVRRVLGTAALLLLTVHLASPYFGPFMLGELHLSYLEYMAASVAVVVLKSVSLGAWGQAIDRYGARNVFLLAVMLVALVPLPWFWAHGISVVLIAQLFSGFSWGGHEVAQFTLLLEIAAPEARLRVFAAMNTLNGLAQLVGSLLGGAILFAGPPGRSGFVALFMVSALARLVVALAAPAVIPARVGSQHINRPRMLLRLMGVRASGGIDHRPLAVDQLDEGSESP
ncbi:MAG: MFS transporter [Acidobacteria bacterium]|nr:MFS transporter [Acidobacteriota bacterium]